MSSLLVTGGAGFIGSNFVQQAALQSDDPIVVLDALTYAGNLASISGLIDNERITFVHGDICNQPLVVDTMRRHEVAAVVHFAAETHVDRSILGPQPFLRTNIDGTASLLQAALEVWQERLDAKRNRFIHVSTDEVFGSLGPEDRPFDENTPYQPNSPYAASKASSDHLARAWHRTFGLPTIITNCSNNYGPRQFPEKLIPLMTLNAFEGRRLPVYGDGAQIRDWLHVEDHCQALLVILERGEPGETYCIGGGCERANLDIIRNICRIVDDRAGRQPGTTEELIEHVKDRPGHDRRYAMDASKLERTLSWAPRYTLEQSLPAVIDWYAENSRWWSGILNGSYRHYYELQYGNDGR